ncbi:DUF4132 domain-containing protein [Actinomadura barringtoniae]|uniref:DUF4132 domain-containing protein n=1 Tax=Actinomadura barringtoniae TaxID=1427535 RepID=A0A939PID0_9ACTN|nr:DUF4132 domain-containing protein [Actinomadura barringtoniae]MBO2449734.1 DUF4132 domain-containing protein [Actinomadura barringtoniae]
MTELPDWVPEADGDWVKAFRERLRDLPPELDELGRHLAAVNDHLDDRRKLKPAWAKRTAVLLSSPGAPGFVLDALRLLANGSLDRQAGRQSNAIAIGIAMAAGQTGDPAAVPDLITVARVSAAIPGEGSQLRNDALAVAAFYGLADLNHQAALDGLWLLYRLIDYVVLREDRLAPVMREAATRMGVPEEVQQERAVPAHGLLLPDRTGTFGPDDQRTISGKTPFRAELTVEDAHTVALTWIDDEDVRKRTAHPFATPRGFKKRYGSTGIEGAQRHAKRVVDTLRTERIRIRDLDEARVWTFDDWAHYYRDHPITGAVTAGLIWEFETDGTWTAALPADSAPSGKERVRLWRASRAKPAEVQAWRDRLAGSRQPFDQFEQFEQ